VNGPELAVIMDPIASIDPAKDSALAMLLEAQARGWGIHCGELSDI
jgi:glutathione synthase